jgi:hypothetical protein
LFYPFLHDEGKRARLSSALQLSSAIVAWDFEAIPDLAERTNFDLQLSLADGSCAYIEVKLTESTFGTAQPNERHVQKLADTYRPRLLEAR